MRLVFGLVLILGIGLAGFAAYLAKSRFEEYQQTVAAQAEKLKSNVPLQPVFIVTRQIGYGEYIKKDDVKKVSWPENAIPEGAFQKEEDLFPESGELRTAQRIMEKHEALMAIKLTEPGQVPGFQLQPGMRAFTIKVDLSSGVGGFLRPGSRVDVYWTGRSRGREITTRIDTGLELLAVDQKTDSNQASPTIARTVTVAASPTQVAALAQANSSGRLTLALVGANDISETNAPIETDIRAVIGEQAEVVVEPEVKVEEKKCYITTGRGTERVKIEIACRS